MTARPCTVCRALGSRRPTPGCGYCREAAALRAAARLLTPLQRYRARLLRLAEIADRCGLGPIAHSFLFRARLPRRGTAADDVAWLRMWAEWRAPGPLPVIGRLLLLSAADEIAALLRAKGGAP